MFANFLIGLREGLEAGLIVGILVAYLVKSDRRDLLPKLWTGVGISIAIMLALGAVLTWGPYNLDEATQELIVGLTSIVAVGLVTWMIFWMNSHGSGLTQHLQGQVDSAMKGSAFGIVTIAVVAVAREGIETALFVWSTSKSGGGEPALGAAVLGITTAVVLSWLIYLGLLRINLRKFFAWTGAFLIIVAAGVLSYAVGELAEVGLLPEGEPVFTADWLNPDNGILGSIMFGIFNFSHEPTLLQLIAWAGYIVIVGAIFIAVLLRRPQTPAPEVVGESIQPVTDAADLRVKEVATA